MQQYNVFMHRKLSIFYRQIAGFPEAVVQTSGHKYKINFTF